MSEKAKRTLINIGTRRQGATTAPITDDAVRLELMELGYLGKGGGLTRKGSWKRDDLVKAELDAIFN